MDWDGWWGGGGGGGTYWDSTTLGQKNYTNYP